MTHVAFEKNESIEKQLISTMLDHEVNLWEEETRHKYVNKLKEYAEEERQLFLNAEFMAFAIRFDQSLGNKDAEPFPLLFDVSQLKKLLDDVLVHVTTGFYSELEEIIASLKIGFHTILQRVQELERMEQDASNVSSENELKILFEKWMREEKVFREYSQYVAACYQSVPKNRVGVLKMHFRPYQDLEKLLFKVIAPEKGFSRAIALHHELSDALRNEYDKILFQGFVLKTDEMIESLVLGPVVHKYESKVDDVLTEDGEKGREDVEEREEAVDIP